MSFDWTALAEYSLIGLLSGGLLALIALGFVLIYKGTGVINFAMGEFMMLGAYFFYTANVIWGLPGVLALPLTLAAVALVAALIERTILRPLAGQPVISVLMATIGLASALHGAVDAIWGGNNYEMPQLLPRKAFPPTECSTPPSANSRSRTAIRPRRRPKSCSTKWTSNAQRRPIFGPCR